MTQSKSHSGLTKMLAKQIKKSLSASWPVYQAQIFFKPKEEFIAWVKQNYKTNKVKNYAFSVLYKNTHLSVVNELIDEGYFTTASHSDKMLTLHYRITDLLDIEIAKEQKAKN